MMAEAGGSSTETITETVPPENRDGQQPEGRSLTIKLRKRKTDKKVEWSSDTVDNEHLGRRSSKCCCIFEKPRQFGESSTESEDEDDGCGNAHCIRGHRKKGGGSLPDSGHGQQSHDGTPNSSDSHQH
ncbi:E3 ubiquitin-protein ligase PPP1R11 [Polypterus senegalus]|nr:E3 ubiquitin-protein ligase PPP1R11 [Polypterus senegalus]